MKPDPRDGYRFLSARAEKDGRKVYVALFVSRYGEQRLATLDVVEAMPMETDRVTVTALEEALAADGHVALYGIEFEVDSARLRDRSQEVLETMAAYVKARPDHTFWIVGHTDATGGRAYNMSLSKERALADAGVDVSDVEAFGVGPFAPVATNRLEAVRCKNRRVELVVVP